MREKQPIDDLFERTLFNAEVTPPTAVRNALGHELGWADSTRSAMGLLPLLMLVIGLVGAGAAVWSWNTDEQVGLVALTETKALAPRNAEGVTDVSGGEVPYGPLPVTANSDPDHLREQTAKATEAESDHDNGSVPLERLQVSTSALQTSSSKKSLGQASPIESKEHVGLNTIAARNTRTTNKSGAAAEHASEQAAQGSTSPSGERSFSPTPVQPTAGPIATLSQGTGSAIPATFQLDQPNSDLGIGSGTWGEKDLAAQYLDPLTIANLTELATGDLATRKMPLQYVLPKGTWWIGAFVGMGIVSGHWKGDQLGDLDQAERWKSTLQGGLQLGRVWRSGWNISVGLGASQVRSVFRYDEKGPVSSFSEVDTTWANSTFAGSTIYTWNIDTLQVQRTEGSLRRDARNQYTAVQVPITFGWHGELRRIRYGAFAGVLAWIPTQRKGLTLQRDNADGPTSTIALQDNKVQDRFGMQVHGTAGLSLGYAITEHFDVYVEPMVTSPIYSSGNGDMPWLTRPTLQLRIQYEL